MRQEKRNIWRLFVLSICTLVLFYLHSNSQYAMEKRGHFKAYSKTLNSQGNNSKKINFGIDSKVSLQDFFKDYIKNSPYNLLLCSKDVPIVKLSVLDKKISLPIDGKKTLRATVTFSNDIIFIVAFVNIEIRALNDDAALKFVNIGEGVLFDDKEAPGTRSDPDGEFITIKSPIYPQKTINLEFEISLQPNQNNIVGNEVGVQVTIADIIDAKGVKLDSVDNKDNIKLNPEFERTKIIITPPSN